ncbi:dihydroneopterin aldolase [Nocardia otitidiscaviarum]|uniref:dihydroneopterin aldolase n=1 Tax=Nocardia otitidiscaviarum TaxID=1823 RepID=UPI001894D3BD|nr:dihydroneopterin aldolase [Nocardia otitidiscaviarum]MBF6179148.1 dihydroneopterin aldolase [Nocardia otitidiscaviarum]
MSTDRIELRGLRVFAHHGVFDFEKRDGQEFVVDLTLWTDFSAAAKSDDIADTIHYGELADSVVRIVSARPRDLIETVVSEVADAVMTDLRVHAVEVVLHKPAAPIPHSFEDVRVVTSRRREAS